MLFTKIYLHKMIYDTLLYGKSVCHRVINFFLERIMV